MATTYKIFLDRRRERKNNSYPLKMRITLNRKCKEVPLNVSLPIEAWDETKQRVKPSHPNEKLITLKISKTLKELQETSLKFDTTDTVISLDNLANVVNKKQSNDCTFFSYAKQQIDTMIQSGRVGNAIAYKDATNKLLSFTNMKGLKFESIDYKLLESFTSTMLSKGIKVNTIAIYMREIRAIYNKAIKEGIVEQKYYPFNKYRIKTAKTISRALTVDEMKSIVELKLEPNTAIWHNRNYFLLSFCLIGTNFTDIFKLTSKSIINDRIIFDRSKTHKIYSIKLHPIAKQILSQYYNPDDDSYYLLPVLKCGDCPEKHKKDAKQAIKTTNEYLYKIAGLCSLKQNVTSYYARYSWANICKGLGFSKDLIAEALGHSYGNAVTGIYLDNYGNEIIDKANEAVISAVFLG